MKPAWSVILLTTLIGAAQGLFLAGFLSGGPRLFALIALALAAAGLAASFFHLGRPERAWRSAAMWRTSWLSREVIVLPAFMAAVAAWAVFPEPWIGWIGVALAIALFVCTGMIYACLKFLQEWHTPLTVVNYTALGIASGTTLAAVLMPSFIPAALAAGALAWALRLASLARNARLRPKSTLATAIGVKHPRIRQIAQGAMGGSFNTREFFHGRPREVVLAARWALVALVFPAPALLLLLGQPAAAFLAQYAGLIAERWYFFADARHPQNLYYQAIA
ncbi:MAG TPA: DmsC/YnfH family molybdoenzyme membrane anchor subunit [Burkholderiales bacterium]|nr:DmsC/YnfH family molybdoenzyme membrane anchor subunit [Burkholderiales bacterium]